MSGGAAKIGKKLVNQLDLQKQNKQLKTSKKGGKAFKEALKTQKSQKIGQIHKARKAIKSQKIGNQTMMSGVAKAAKARSADPATKVGKSQKKRGIGGFLSQFAKERQDTNEVMKLAYSGAPLSGQQYMVVQAKVYSFMETQQVVFKGIEQATSSVKETMRTQV